MLLVSQTNPIVRRPAPKAKPQSPAKNNKNPAQKRPRETNPAAFIIIVIDFYILLRKILIGTYIDNRRLITIAVDNPLIAVDILVTRRHN